MIINPATNQPITTEPPPPQPQPNFEQELRRVVNQNKILERMLALAIHTTSAQKKEFAYDDLNRSSPKFLKMSIDFNDQTRIVTIQTRSNDTGATDKEV